MDDVDQRRITDGLMALLLSIRKYPTSIKYSRYSQNCHKIAERLSSCVSRERELFSQAGRNDATIVLLDRRDDPITVFFQNDCLVPKSCQILKTESLNFHKIIDTIK